MRNEVDVTRLGDIVEVVERAIKAEAYYPVESPMNCSGCPILQALQAVARLPNTEDRFVEPQRRFWHAGGNPMTDRMIPSPERMLSCSTPKTES